jgi:hypothetical protein
MELNATWLMFVVSQGSETFTLKEIGVAKELAAFVGTVAPSNVIVLVPTTA